MLYEFIYFWLSIKDVRSQGGWGFIQSALFGAKTFRSFWCKNFQIF